MRFLREWRRRHGKAYTYRGRCPQCRARHTMAADRRPAHRPNLVGFRCEHCPRFVMVELR